MNENILSELNEKINIIDLLQKEMKKNEEIINSFNSINKDNLDKEVLIANLKTKIIELNKNGINNIFIENDNIRNIGNKFKKNFDVNENKNFHNITDYLIDPEEQESSGIII